MLRPLSSAVPEEAMKIVSILHEPRMAQRLSDLGFTPGECVSCVMKRRSGNISAYLVRNTVIALRRAESSLILAEPVSREESS